MTSEARFFVKLELHKKCGVFSARKKVYDFFDALEKNTVNSRCFFIFGYVYEAENNVCKHQHAKDNDCL